jgi:hypothetical protein
MNFPKGRVFLRLRWKQAEACLLKGRCMRNPLRLHLGTTPCCHSLQLQLQEVQVQVQVQEAMGWRTRPSSIPHSSAASEINHISRGHAASSALFLAPDTPFYERTWIDRRRGEIRAFLRLRYVLAARTF